MRNVRNAHNARNAHDECNARVMYNVRKVHNVSDVHNLLNVGNVGQLQGGVLKNCKIWGPVHNNATWLIGLGRLRHSTTANTSQLVLRPA